MNRLVFFAHTKFMGKKLLRIFVVLIVLMLSCSMLLSALLSSASARFPRSSGCAIETSARAMATIEVSSGRVFYTKNAAAQMPMASTTKIVTAITVIEAVADLDEIVNVNKKAIGIEGTSIYLQIGEKLTVRELLLGMMLRSGNDAAMALALHVAPTKEDFAEMMNQLAKKCGAVNSTFKNPHGLDEDGHLTTAIDLARITAHAMKNPDFAEIVQTKTATISGVEYKRVLHNKNRLLRTLDGCVGVKTGFTRKAGRCFVGASKVDGMTTVCVVLNCGPMFEESAALMQAASNEFRLTQILKADETFEVTNRVDAQTGQAARAGISMLDFSYPLRENENPDITIADNMVEVHLNDKKIFSGECVELFMCV